MAFRSRQLAPPRLTLIVVLLALTVALAALVAYEAHEASVSHRVTAERALRDYASVAAWEFVADVRDRVERRVADVLAPATSSRAASPFDPLLGPEEILPSARATLRCPSRADSTLTAFRVDLQAGTVATRGSAVSPGLLACLPDSARQ